MKPWVRPILGTSEAWNRDAPQRHDGGAGRARRARSSSPARRRRSCATALDAFYRFPEETPERETVLERGDVIVAVEIEYRARSHRRSALSQIARSRVVRIRAGRRAGRPNAAARRHDRALAHSRSAASRPCPWRRAVKRERELRRAPNPDDGLFRRAAERRSPTRDDVGANAFKVELAQRAIVRALRTLTEATWA